MHALRLFGFLVFLFFLSFSQALSQTLPRIELFSPQNTVKDVRQVAVRFSEQMVPFGSPRVESQVFDIECPEKGIARWADERNWIYDFERDLPAGVRCEFRLKAGLKTLADKETLVFPRAVRQFGPVFQMKAIAPSTRSRSSSSSSMPRRRRTPCLHT